MVKSLAQGFAGLDLDIVLADEADVVLHDLPWQPEIGDSDGEHAAGHGQGLEDGHVISPPSQMIGGIKSRRTGANHGHAFCLRLFKKSGGGIFSCLSSQSEANRFSEAMAIGSSISPRLHMFSQGWLQTRPQIPARGIVSRIRLKASSYLPAEIRDVYPTASQRTGQVFSQGAKTRASQFRQGSICPGCGLRTHAGSG